MKKTQHQPHTRKRSFLLIELLISFTLLSLCLFPLIRPHLVMKKEQIEQMVLIQLDPIEQNAFCRFKEQLMSTFSPSFDQLSKKAAGELPCSYALKVGKGKTLPLRCSYETECLEVANKTSLESKGIVVSITFTFHTPTKEYPFTHALFVERRA